MWQCRPPSLPHPPEGLCLCLGREEDDNPLLPPGYVEPTSDSAGMQEETEAEEAMYRRNAAVVAGVGGWWGPLMRCGATDGGNLKDASAASPAALGRWGATTGPLGSGEEAPSASQSSPSPSSSIPLFKSP